MTPPFTKTLIALTILNLLPCTALWDIPREWKMTVLKILSYIIAANAWPSFVRVLTTFKTVDNDLPVSVVGNLCFHIVVKLFQPYFTQVTVQFYENIIFFQSRADVLWSLTLPYCLTHAILNLQYVHSVSTFIPWNNFSYCYAEYMQVYLPISVNSGKAISSMIWCLGDSQFWMSDTFLSLILRKPRSSYVLIFLRKCSSFLNGSLSFAVPLL